MLKCPNCGTQYETDSNFCENCGAKLELIADESVADTAEEFVVTPAQSDAMADEPVEETITEEPVIEEPMVEEPVIEEPTTEEAVADEVVAQNDGFTVTVEEPVAEETAVVKKKKSGLIKKLLAIGIPCIAVLVAAAILLSMFVFKKKEQNYAFYIKDDNLFFTKASKIAPRQITDDLYSDVDHRSTNWLFQLSRDGKYIFFVDNVDEDTNNSYDLYYCKANDKKSEPVKLDSEVCYYSISEDGKCVTYLKGGQKESVLYQHNLKEKTKIASDVYQYAVSLDGKTIYYLTVENNLYLKQGKKDAEKISSDVYNFYLNNKCDTVVYLKEDTIYKKVGTKDAQKIASDVEYINHVYDSGEIYYVKSTTEQIKYSDLVEDDLKESDDAITEPVAPERPENWSYYSDLYDDYYEANDAYNADWDAYYDEYDAYQEKLYEYEDKLERDELRQEIEDAGTFEISKNSFYYYNGKEEKLISDSYYSSYTYNYDTPVIIYGEKNVGESKVKFSEIDYISDIENNYSENFKVKFSIAAEDATAAVDVGADDICYFVISDDGKAIYYLNVKAEESETNSEMDMTGEVYKVAIDGNKIEAAELYDSDVSYVNGEENEVALSIYGNDVVYFKDYDASKYKATLYVNAKEASNDVFCYSGGYGYSVGGVYYSYINYWEDTESLFFMTDYDTENNKGVLNVYKKGKSEKIGEDVYDYKITPTGDVVYLSDYNTKKEKGDLFIYKGGKSEKVDTDVQAIVVYNYYDDKHECSYGYNFSFQNWYENQKREDVEIEIEYEDAYESDSAY